MFGFKHNFHHISLQNPPTYVLGVKPCFASALHQAYLANGELPQAVKAAERARWPRDSEEDVRHSLRHTEAGEVLQVVRSLMW